MGKMWVRWEIKSKDTRYKTWHSCSTKSGAVALGTKMFGRGNYTIRKSRQAVQGVMSV